MVGSAGLEGFGGARLLASDARVAFLLINHARLRTVARLFGVGPDQANLVTAIALLTLAETVRRKVRALMEGPMVPAFEDGLLGGAVVRELPVVRVPVPRLAVQPGRREEGWARPAGARPLRPERHQRRQHHRQHPAGLRRSADRHQHHRPGSRGTPLPVRPPRSSHLS